MKRYAIIAAAGNGERLAGSNSKMLEPILGKPLLSYTLDVFEETDCIDEIVLVVRAQDKEDIDQEIIYKNNYHKIKSIVVGGFTRQDSVYNGLQVIKENEGIVCIHDGARPMVKQWMIVNTIKMIDSFTGVVLAIPAFETIKKVNLSHMLVEKTVDRNEFWIAQTPQTFRLREIKEYYKRAKIENLKVTDDSALVDYYGGKVAILLGSQDNIKVTTKVDLLLVELLLNNSYYTK